MDIKELYKELSKPLPKEAIQRSKGSETKKGYDTTGYGYQYLVNRFNEVLGIGNWNWSFKETDRAKGQYRSGQEFHLVTGLATVTVYIEDKEISHSEYGGHQSANLTDAFKGASTNALKKTSAFFGVGKEAFEGTIDEDNSKQPDIKKSADVDYEQKLRDCKTATELQAVWKILPPAEKGRLFTIKEELKNSYAN